MSSKPTFLIAMLCALTSVCFPGSASGQSGEFPYQQEIFWQLGDGHSITWNLASEKRLPHQDHLEMDGQQVAAIIHYTVDENKQLQITRDILFPQLRRFPTSTDPDYFRYRAYLRDAYQDDVLPVMTIGDHRFRPGSLDSVVINGKIQFFHQAANGIQIVRSIFPAMRSRLLVEKWTLTNVSKEAQIIQIGQTNLRQQETGVNGRFLRSVFSDATAEVALAPAQGYSFGIYFTAQLNEEAAAPADFALAEQQRDQFLDSIRTHLVVQSPDAILNTLFYFSKIRAAESIYQTKMGLVHSPGGGNYYTGVWANDQAEYSGPFFPYLGYQTGNIAALNAYRMFLRNIPAGDQKIWASFEMNGELPCCSKDRGDAAMIAYGATHFCLATGSKAVADTLWPLIAWGLAYCERMKTAEGVIASQSDELEGRFPSGSANLSTSALYYGALLQAADLARAMGKSPALGQDYTRRAKNLAAAIENYFGAEMEGLHTYKYYQENTTLRSWICLPLVMGLHQRKAGTLDALFSKLWTDNGVRIEGTTMQQGKQEVFWDRGTLYAFRGAFKAGAADRALEKLQSFSKTRLTGFHVPYVVEAWPENSMAHLSAESALYCRIFTEGILGLQPTGFYSFSIQPNLPTGWNTYSVKNIAAFNTNFDVSLERQGNALQLTVHQSGKLRLKKQISNGETVLIELSNKK